MKKFPDNPLVIKTKPKQNNNLSNTFKPKPYKNENTILQGKRRANSTEKETSLKKNKIQTHIRTKSTTINDNYRRENNNHDNRNMRTKNLNSPKDNTSSKGKESEEIKIKKYNDRSDSRERIHKYFEELNMKMSQNEKKLYSMNQINMEAKKNLKEYLVDQKIRLLKLNYASEFVYIRENFINEILKLKKLAIEKTRKNIDDTKNNIEKKMKVNEEIRNTIIRLETKKKDIKEAKEQLHEKLNLLKMNLEENKRINQNLDELKYKIARTEKLLEISNKKITEMDNDTALFPLWNYYSSLISNHNIFKKFIIIRGYDYKLSKEISQDLINCDVKKEILYLKAFLDNSNILPNNNNNTSKNGGNELSFKSSHFSFKNDSMFDKKVNDCSNNYSIQTIPLKYDLLITLFNTKYEEVDYTSYKQEEDIFINKKLEMVLDAHFINIIKEETTKNLILCYFTDVTIDDISENKKIINKKILDLIKIFINIINNNTSRTISLNDKKTHKLVTNEFEINISYISNKEVYKLHEIKKVDAGNRVEFDMIDFSRDKSLLLSLENSNFNDSSTYETFGGIIIKVIFSGKESQINLVLCNIRNNEFTSSLLKRGRVLNSKKLKKEIPNNNLNTLNNTTNFYNHNDSKTLTTMGNNQKNLTTSSSVNINNYFEEIEIKNNNVYINLLDFEAKFSYDTETLPKFSDEAFEISREEKFEKIYKYSNEKDLFQYFYDASDLKNYVYCNNQKDAWIAITKENTAAYKNFNISTSKTNSCLQEYYLNINDNKNKTNELNKKKVHLYENVKYSLDPSIIKDVGKYFV